jgi:anti-anti-sigma regulatory factor
MGTIEISGTAEQLEVRVTGNLASAADVAPLATVLAAADAHAVVVDLSSTMFVSAEAAVALRSALREVTARLAVSVVVPSIDVRVELVRADVDHVVSLLIDRSQIPSSLSLAS